MPPKWVPPFAWGGDPNGPAYERSRFLETAARVMERRDVAFDDATRQWLGACWDVARGTD